MSMKKAEKRVLVLGHGIAGASLSFALRQRGAEVLVLDRNPAANECSRVAAGLCNPVTGRNYSLTWNAKVIFQGLAAFYKSWEREVGADFWHPLPILRWASSVKGANALLSRLGDEAFGHFATELPKGELPVGALAGVRLNGGGFVDAVNLLRANREYLKAKACFLEEEASVEDLLAAGLRFRGQTFDCLVDCRGRELGNWFPAKVLVPNRGLIAECAPLELAHIEIANGWKVPIGADRVRFGSTYFPHAENLDYSDKEKNELLEKAQNSGIAASLIQHIQAGIRPTVKDRRPLLGSIGKDLYVFGGLGSKGFSMVSWLAPLLAQQIMLGNSDLPAEVSATRFGLINN